MPRVAMLSVHGCPVARLGERDTGGMNVYVMEVAKELGRLGNQVDVYTRFHDPTTRKSSKSARVPESSISRPARTSRPSRRCTSTFLSFSMDFACSDSWMALPMTWCTPTTGYQGAPVWS